MLVQVKYLGLSLGIIIMIFVFSSCQGNDSTYLNTGKITKVKTPQPQERNDTLSDDFQYEKDRNEIRRLIIERNLNGLLNLMNELPKKRKTENYNPLLADICTAFNSYNFGDDKQYLYARRCVKQVLKEADKISVGLELKMIENLQGVEEYRAGLIPKESWESDRAERIELLLHLWQKLQNGVDKDFDFNAPENQAVLNVPVPAPGYMPGISPESIKEPEIRAKYEEARRINKKKLERRNLQLQLQKLNKKLPDFVESFLTQVYSIAPFNLEGLKKDINRFNLTLERSRKILDEVNEEVTK